MHSLSGKDPLSTGNGRETSPLGGGGNVQRKITPWKAMMREDGDLAGSSGHERAAARERAHPHLIVIGSLVDRLPNLGIVTLSVNNTNS
jgi:hypothetical protein